MKKEVTMKKQFSVLCLMLALAVLLLPATGYCYREKPSDLIPDDSCTGGVKKILITYDTKHGATSIVAKKIFDTLCDNASDNASIDLIFVENLDADTIQDYDAIIIGSPIYIGKWLRGINKLLKRNHAAIAQIPSAFFVTCTYIGEDTPERQAYAKENYVGKNLKDYPDVSPLDIGILGGEFTFNELYPIEFFLMKLAGFEEGDFIDDAKIETWAKGAAEQLL
jgi:menaquinone-dependent protoporphyrinogen oxidase